MSSGKRAAWDRHRARRYTIGFDRRLPEFRRKIDGVDGVARTSTSGPRASWLPYAAPIKAVLTHAHSESGSAAVNGKQSLDLYPPERNFLGSSESVVELSEFNLLIVRNTHDPTGIHLQMA